jgi:hypothetical protein
MSRSGAAGDHKAWPENLKGLDKMDAEPHHKHDAKARRQAGSFGVAGFVVFLVALPLYYLAGPEPPIEDTAATSAFVARASTFILARATLADPLIMIGFLVFLAGFRHIIRHARPDHEWVSSLVLGAGLVVITLELVGDALQAAATRS